MKLFANLKLSLRESRDFLFRQLSPGCRLYQVTPDKASGRMARHMQIRRAIQA